MQILPLSRSVVAIAVGTLIAFGAVAQSAPDRESQRKALDAARTELQEAARRVATLSRELGEPGEGVFVFERRAIDRPVLGVLLDTDASRGVRVSGVTPDSGAAKAGLRAGDRIVGVDGQSVTGADGEQRLRRLRELLASLKADKPVRIGYEREGRTATVAVVPRPGPPVAFFGGQTMTAEGDVRFIRGHDGVPGLEADRMTVHPGPGAVRIEQHDDSGRVIERRIVRTDGPAGAAPHGMAPGMRREIIRMARDGGCTDGARCEHLALAEALRWNGLNLASVDANLGRYFGAEDGVLVVSAGPELVGLQSGDVIRKVDGRTVRNPRDVMDVLRGKLEGGSVGVDYLRDRKPGTTQLKVPKALRMPLPPPAREPPRRVGANAHAPRDVRRIAMAGPAGAPLPPPPPRID